MENPLHGGSVDTAPPPPPRAGGGGRDAPQASAFAAAVHARSMPAAPASPGALLRALGGGFPGAAAGVRVAQSRDYHLEPAVRGPGEEGEVERAPRADAARRLPEQVLIPTNMMGRVEGHAVDVNAVADLVKVERALVARSGAVMNGHGGTEPPGVLLQGGASVVKQVNGRPGGAGRGPLTPPLTLVPPQALGWDEDFMAKNLELGKLDGVDVEAVGAGRACPPAGASRAREGGKLTTVTPCR